MTMNAAKSMITSKSKTRVTPAGATEPRMADDMISVVMSNYRGARWLAPAIASVLAQTHMALELIVVDDASGDDSVAIVRTAMADDPRVRLVECPVNLGPSSARNLALEAARGDWIAVMDSDDLIHPARLERMLSAARHLGCDAVADDMIYFGEAPGEGGRTLMQSLALTEPHPLTLRDLLRSDNAASGLPSYGYLKPLIARRVLDDLRYDPDLRMGEDFDLYARMLLGGAQMMLLPDPLYLYRRHAASLSYRHATTTLEPLLTAHEALARAVPQDDPATATALRQRRDALTSALRYARLVAAIKARDLPGIAGMLTRHPRLVRSLWQSLQERRMRNVATAIPRTPMALVLIARDAALPEGVALDPQALRIDVPLIAAPGRAGDAPLAALAATLSDLAGRHDLRVLAIGAAGRHAAGMLPPSARVQVWPTPTADD